MSTILQKDEGRIRFISLNRPEKRNALNDELIADLRAALAEADANDEIRAIVIRGEGKDFCSGADLSALQKIAASSYEENLEDAKSLADLFTMIRHVSVPVIAAVHGRALAGGCGLATACDLVVSTSTARFGYPEVRIGFVPAIVATFLKRNISEKRAFEMITQGFEFSADEALEFGLINKVFSDESFESSMTEYASIYERVSKSGVQLSKSLLYGLDALTFTESIDLGVRINAEARMTDDCQKGIRKFLEKL
jgi:methylglutaconyl-CoA hydratase